MTCAAHVRPAREADVARVRELVSRMPEAPHWNKAAYRAFLVQPAGTNAAKCLLVADVEDRVQGFAAASVVMEDAELESIGVEEEHRRAGIGRLLLQAIEEWARMKGARMLQLEVRASNSTAQRLYQRACFERIGQRPGYYAHPAEDAVLLRKQLVAGDEL